jgi:hypothetical protein
VLGTKLANVSRTFASRKKWLSQNVILRYAHYPTAETGKAVGLNYGNQILTKERAIMNIYVGNLSFKTTEEDLRQAFEAFGEVSSAKIIVDAYSGKSRGFGFVEMPNQSQAQAAIAGLNGKELGGFTLTVNEAKPRESRGGRPGGGRGSGGPGGKGGRGGGGGRRPY